ncbi:MAG: HNH endonuclease, partial [Candidatus Riesia sp.]|nr:HNH endonuclease [Candidatus Riesia sp.]
INPTIYNRDNHTCYNCNNTNCEVHAHHIFNFAAHKELRKNMFNIITLCKKCHQKYHRKYGYRNNLTQFEEFTNKRYIYHQSLLNYYEFYHRAF